MYRKPVFNLFSKLYGVNQEEIKEPLESFSTFNAFFTREVLPRNIDIANTLEIVSPADSKILSISEITQDEVLIIKGKKYKLGYLLTGIKEYEIKDEILKTMKKKSSNNKIFQIIFYLNPGDYHRFHSPTTFFLKRRLHLVGYLFPVRESYLESHDAVFETNERISVFGESALHGFFALVFVGALNVGTISLNFDKELATNSVLPPRFQRFSLKEFTIDPKRADIFGNDDLLEFEDVEIFEFTKKNNINEKFPQFQKGLLVEKGIELGRFNMGSTVVMLFEAPPNFEFKVKEGQKIKYGDTVGLYQKQ